MINPKPILEGHGWRVLFDTGFQYPAIYYVRPISDDFSEAERMCAEQARDGNSDAITAVLICDQDATFQETVAKVTNGEDGNEWDYDEY